MKILNFTLFTVLILFSCKNQKEVLEFKVATKQDFAAFLTTKPYEKIDENSYNKGQDDYFFNLYEEVGNPSWEGQEWHRDNILPLWKSYKADNRLLSERDYQKAHFKNFLASEPFPGIDETSYNNGEDDFYFDLFQENGINTWQGQEWHRDNVLPHWRKYKESHSLKSIRYANKEDFIRFIATRPTKEIDSSSYNYGQDTWYFLLFQDNNPDKWKGQEWHRNNVFPKWIIYKQKNGLK